VSKLSADLDIASDYIKDATAVLIVAGAGIISYIFILLSVFHCLCLFSRRFDLE